ncbi:MAG: hypothetical protein ACREL5_07285 [Gemmatimonadales bacterium]
MTHGQSFALVFFIVMGLVIGLVAVLGKTDIGQAIADAIRHNSGANEGAAVRRELEEMKAEIEQLRADLDLMHHELLETGDRLDFAERLLARGSESRMEGPLQ